MDPIAFRKLNLNTSTAAASLTSERLVTLFDAVAQEAKWEARPPASKLAKGDVVTGQGFAVSGFSGTNVANLARVEVNKTTGKIRVTHLYGFGDSGLAINPDAIESQFLGGMMFFLSKTLLEEVRFDRKNVTSSDWVTYPILRFKDVTRRCRRESAAAQRPACHRSGRGRRPRGRRGSRQRLLRRHGRPRRQGAADACAYSGSARKRR